MTYMLARNRVEDFDRWYAVFSSHRDAHRAAGLTLRHLWQERGDRESVFFVFEVEEVARAEAFVAAPESAEAGRAAGVIDGEYHYVEDLPEAIAPREKGVAS